MQYCKNQNKYKMKTQVFKKLTELAEILTARKIDPSLFVSANFQDFSGKNDSRYLVWKVTEVDYEVVYDCKLTKQQKSTVFYFSIAAQSLVLEYPTLIDINIVCDIENTINIENVSNDNELYDLAERLGFMDSTKTTKLIEKIDEMIAFHQKFI